MSKIATIRHTNLTIKGVKKSNTRLKSDMIFIVAGMKQEKGIACSIRYGTLNDVDAAKALISDAGSKFGPRSSQSYSDPRIQLEYHVDLTSASIGIHGDRICDVKVNL